MKRIILALGALLSIVSPALSGTIKIVERVPFSPIDSSLTMDLYLPKSVAPTACIITIQGGGFAAQNGKRFKTFANYLANNGFSVALISYRGRPKHTYKDTLADTKAAVRFVRRNAEKYNINEDKIGAMGRSAGGTLSALLATTGEDKDPDARIQAAVCLAGVFDFVSRFTDQRQVDLQPNLKLKKKTNGEWIGSAFSADDPNWLSASAIKHVDALDPPILFLHSRNDRTVPWLQSQQMCDALRRAGVLAQIKIYDDGGHGVKPTRGDSDADMLAFFRTHLQ